MKKIALLATCIIGMAVCATAQYSDKITFGIKVGVNLDHQLFIKEGITTLPDNKIGFHAGVVVDMNPFSNFFFQPQLLFTTKGSSTTKTGEGTSRNELYYFELPLLLSYVFPVQRQLGLRIHAGPTASFGLWGNHTDIDGNKVDLFTDSRYKRIDAGLCFGGGLEYRQVFWTLNYDVGLYNILQKTGDYDHIHNRMLMVSMGYYF
jgi:hypothetical protein